MSISKTYIIYYEWSNTADNHAGMAYLVKEIKNRYPYIVKLIKIPKGINNYPHYFQRLHFYILIYYLKFILKSRDKILFMEYLGVGSGNQTGIAMKLRGKMVTSSFYGMVHLSGNNLMKLYNSKDDIRKGVEMLDRIIVFGSSLKTFFESLGFGNKVTQTFHYADNSYYKSANKPKQAKLQVIHMGNLERNFDFLKNIIEDCPDIDFHICQGVLDLNKLFNGLPNVEMYRYLAENELLELMQKCHVSLNVLDDTVGSNVITTSMACGLVNVASDVGSIRDYCNDENSILCKNKMEFVFALNKLSSDKLLLQKLSSASLNHSKNLSMDKSIDFFNEYILKQ
jgi:glycosyltransferase involved in cell wall biosynthesis